MLRLIIVTHTAALTIKEIILSVVKFTVTPADQVILVGKWWVIKWVCSQSHPQSDIII